MANPKYNWEEIEQDYVTGKLTYRELADKYNASESRIGVVGGKRIWAKKRKEYREGLSKAAINEAAKTSSFEKARFDELITRACDAVVAAMAALATDEYNRQSLTPMESQNILAANQKAQDIKYRALGIPPPKTQSQIDEEGAYKHYLERLAEARVELERGIAIGEVKVIKRSKSNGRGKLNSNDFIEIEIIEPTPGTSKN